MTNLGASQGSLRPCQRTVWRGWLLLWLVGCFAGPVWAVDEQNLDPASLDAIRRGREALIKQLPTLPIGEDSLAAYALIKSGTDRKHSAVAAAVQRVEKRIDEGCYDPNGKPGSRTLSDHPANYFASVDAFLLEAYDAEGEQARLTVIRDWLIAQQRPFGGWNYVNDPKAAIGDTSVSQYAVLGLWACHRAGVVVPTSVWEKAANYFMKTQREDGGFAYRLDESVPQRHRTPRLTMTVAGGGSLAVIRIVLFGDPTPVAKSKHALLERPEGPIAEDPQRKTTLDVGSFDKKIGASVKWVTTRFEDERDWGESWTNYYFYGLERLAALQNLEKFGAHDWYIEGRDYLIRTQAKDGSWIAPNAAGHATSFALLFLSRATQSLIPDRPKLIGGGLLVGGRGLPDSLDQVQMKNNELTSRKLKGSVDVLLKELEKPKEARIEAAQAAILESVDLEHTEELIQQMDRMMRLASDPRPEVRRTVLWAMARTGDVRVARYMIRALNDPVVPVAREASFGLATLSRRPRGVGGVPLDPLDGVAEDAEDNVREAHVQAWQKAAHAAWMEWYLRVRPADDRDDFLESKRKK